MHGTGSDRRGQHRPQAGVALAAALLLTGVQFGGGSVLASPVIEGAQEGRVVIMRPTEALEVLAMARELNRRCRFFPDVADELSGYAARAEIATAAQEGAEAARTALDMAREEAAGMACDEDARDLVSAALEAAREAARQAGIAAVPPAPSLASASRPEPRRRVEHRDNDRGDGMAHRTSRVHRPADEPHKVPQTRRSMDGGRGMKTRLARTERDARKAVDRGKVRQLARRYERLAGTYYLDLRCRRLPYARARQLWQQVRALHYRLLDEGGPSVLLAAKQRARTLAKRRSCASLRLAGR